MPQIITIAALEQAREVFDRMGTAVWVFDIDFGRVAWANDAALQVWSTRSLAELRSRRMKDDMSPAVAERLLQYQSDFERRDAVFNEVWTLYPGGMPRPLRVTFSGIRLEDGRMAMLCEGRDEGEVQPEAVRSAEAVLHTHLMISLHKNDGTTLYMNPAARAAFELDHGRLVDRFVKRRDYNELMSGVRQRGDISLIAQVRTSRGTKWHEITARACLDPASGTPSVLVSEADVSSLKEAEGMAQRLAYRDSLTGLANRHALPAIFDRLGAMASSGGVQLGVFFIDLDEFKAVNDTLGHERGDILLADIAEKLTSLARKTDAVVRLGGDEFLFLTLNKPDAQRGLETIARDMLDLLAVSFHEQNHRFTVTPSIGIAVYPDHGDSLKSVMQCADLAMYQAKQAGRSRFVVFHPEMRAELETRLIMQADLEAAVADGQFEVHYQPRYDVRSRSFSSVEALVRWRHPDHGLIMPGDFIPYCEQTGIIRMLGAFVMERALADCRALEAEGIDLSVSVNVSLKQLNDPGFGAFLRRSLHHSGMKPQKLELELTETLLVHDSATVHANLAEIRALGVKLAIDDFGTGYSNLARLGELSVDCIKIDRSLIRGLPKNAALVQTVISMCKLMSATIVAEGVETQDMASWAEECGCHELQGYHFGKPLPLSDIRKLASAQLSL
ncbi:MAG: EAL domain-containing protein [Proteobacteria bacterium]|nr:EAL domain-containing protein [Pseudomonadota bacterium]